MVNFDIASSWTGEVLTLEECEQSVLEMLDLPGDDGFIKAARLEHYRTTRSWAIGIAEWVLIWLLRPCWNRAANPFPAAPPTDLYRLIKANGRTNLIAPAAK